MTTTTAHGYNYAVVRVVPRVERGEFINVGVILHSRTLHFLDARVELDGPRLLALAPDIALATVEEHLRAFCHICQGVKDAGPIALLPPQERFYWLVAPRSTIIQTSPLHAGVTTTPAQVMDKLMDQMVRRPQARG